jgi:hypothetical protein
MREVLVAIANWRIDKRVFQKIKELPAWSQLSGEAQALVTASKDYYHWGMFPNSDLVSLIPPSLVTGKHNSKGRR